LILMRSPIMDVGEVAESDAVGWHLAFTGGMTLPLIPVEGNGLLKSAPALAGRAFSGSG